MANKKLRAYGTLVHRIDKHFVRRLLVLIVALFIMTFGVALCIRSNIGASPISVIPFALSLFGGGECFGAKIPALSLGEYTYIMNFVLVALQIVVLRKRYNPFQLLQLAIGFIFGFFLDLCMQITSIFQCENLCLQIAQLLVGGAVMGVGIAVEVMTKMVMMPGEGITLAFSIVTGKDFGRVKVVVDSVMVMMGVGLCYAFWSSWQWNIVGIGSIISMVYVGNVVRLIRPRLRFVDKFLFG